MAARRKLEARKKILAIKAREPEATMRNIAERVGVRPATVCNTLQEARERGLLMTDQQTQDFFTREVLEEAARAHKRNLETVRSQLDEWDEEEERRKTAGIRISGETGLETSQQRRKLSGALASAASAALAARNAIVGPVNAMNQQAPAAVMPVVINFVRSDARPMAPIERGEVREATRMPKNASDAS